MANTDLEPIQSTRAERKARFREVVADLMADGMTIGQIARKMYPDEPRLAANLRQRIRRMAYDDPQFAMEVGRRAKGQLLMDLIPTSKAVGKRAGRGRIDAAKLLFETTGFHNPRVKHEHSGDIKLTLNIPRPKFDEDEAVEGEVVED
jgi:hypothetical protein